MKKASKNATSKPHKHRAVVEWSDAPYGRYTAEAWSYLNAAKTREVYVHVCEHDKPRAFISVKVRR